MNIARGFRGFVTAALVLIVVSTATAQYSGGTGEPNDPYQIATAADLIALGQTPSDYDKHFILTADIDLDPNLPGRKIFDKAVIASQLGDDILNPPGTDFTGSFDGKGHAIKNLTISGGAGGCLGLFGQVWNGGRIRNACLENASITGASGASALGCLVGANYEGIIDSCYTIGTVVGGEESGAIGGLVGHNQGTVTYCYALGSVSVGKNSRFIGGFVGWNGGQITQCYASVAMSGWETSTRFGGFAGFDWGSAISNCFWNAETSGLSEGNGGVGLTSAQMQDPDTFVRAGWDFLNVPDSSGGIWARPADGGFPILWWQLPESQRPLPPIFSGGAGQPGDPYLISTAEQLTAIAGNPRLMTAHFKLMADIDLSGVTVLAIGSKVFPFTGVFDGNGHAISGFAPVSTETDCAGLFAYLGGEVKNLGLIAPHVDTQTAWFVGALAGRLDEGTIANCYVQDSNIAGSSRGGIYGGPSTAGGLVGTSSGTIVDCHVACSVFGSTQAGGLVGINSGKIINCTSSGHVSGNACAGGLVGMNQWDGEITGCSTTGDVSTRGRSVGGLAGENTARIVNSYASGNVSGDRRVGGLVGSNGHIQKQDVYYEAPGEIVNSYSTGAVSGNSDVGGLVGFHEIGPVIASFWDVQTSGQSTSAVGVGKTTAQMQDIQPYLDAGWDLAGEALNGTSGVWQMPEESGYPILSTFGGYTPPQLSGSGTPDDPYLISDAVELGAVVHYSRLAHYRLTTSLDLSGIRWATAVVPLLEGSFDGNGHTISHLAIKGGSHLGLFGSLGPGAEVKNLGVEDVNVMGCGHYVAGLAAVSAGTVARCYSTGAVSTGGTGRCSYVAGLIASNAGMVVQCHSTAAIEGISSDAGGLVGRNGGSLTECYSTGTVSTTGGHVGGLAGSNGGTVAQCFSTGAVRTTAGDAGGLAGANYLNGVLTQCYSTGSVSGTSNIGGLVGWNVAALSYCYSTGAVNGKAHAAGLVWGSSYLGSVTACFWDIQTSEQATSTDGTGKTTAEMQSAHTFLEARWDFAGETANGTADIWWIEEGKDYPRLWWEPRPPVRLPVIELDATGFDGAIAEGVVLVDFFATWSRSSDSSA